MNNFRVKDLKNLLREAKRASGTCQGYSTLKKAGLYARCQELGLLETPRDAVVDAIFTPAEQELAQLKQSVSGLTLLGSASQKKRDSFLRRVDRLLDDPTKATDAVMEKMRADARKILTAF